jgi:hypothetical protein
VGSVFSGGRNLFLELTRNSKQIAVLIKQILQTKITQKETVMSIGLLNSYEARKSKIIAKTVTIHTSLPVLDINFYVFLN